MARWLVALLVPFLGAVPAALGQVQELPPLGSPTQEVLPAPRSTTPPADGATQPAAPAATDAPATTPAGRYPQYTLPPVPGLVAPELTKGDPWLNHPEDMPCGPLTTLEVGVLALHLRNQLLNPVTNFNGTDLVGFGGNPLNPTAVPRFGVGWQLPDGCGAIQLSYRFLVTDGNDSPVTGGGPVQQHGRLDFNVIDLDYLTREYSLPCQWEMRWGFGLRFQSLYFDSRYRLLDPGIEPGSFLGESETNSLYTFGIHTLLDLSRKIGHTGFAVVARGDAGVNMGRIKQTAQEQLLGPDPGDGPQLFWNRQDGAANVWTWAGQFGLSYTVPGWNNARFLLGYQYEVWFDVGRLNASRGQLDMQGLVLRAEVSF
jgi:hypothetical protein